MRAPTVGVNGRWFGMCDTAAFTHSISHHVLSRYTGVLTHVSSLYLEPLSCFTLKVIKFFPSTLKFLNLSSLDSSTVLFFFGAVLITKTSS